MDLFFFCILGFIMNPFATCIAGLLYTIYWVISLGTLLIAKLIWTWPLYFTLALALLFLVDNLNYFFTASPQLPPPSGIRPNPDQSHTSAPALNCTDAAHQTSTTAWLNTQRSIIDFTYFSPPGDPMVDAPTRLELRAKANARLVRAFGINNSLTTSSVDTHKQFHAKATAMINEASQNPGRWMELYKLAEGILEYDVAYAKLIAEPLSLADCVRRLCLAVVLVDNFGDQAFKNAQWGVLGKIAARVNEVWVKSKCVGGGDGGRDAVLEKMIAGLEPRENRGKGEVLGVEEVLGIIMPQYETLWRVVLLTFITAFHRQSREENLKRVEGVPGCLGKDDQEALRLAQEGLRLYPSNKRIYRAHGIGMEDQISADVEACHRKAEIWGDDALEFRPERFAGLSDMQKKAYFPYSMGRHKCPAVKVFGNRMITMLVVVLSRAMPPTVGKVTFGDASLDGDAGAALPTGRDELEAWTMKFF